MDVTQFSMMIGESFELITGKEADTTSAVTADGKVLFTAHKTRSRSYQKLYVCSPLSAPTEPGIRRNMLRAQHYMAQLGDYYGCRAVAPHAYLPELLDDHQPEERELAVLFGEKLLALCDALVICGNVISKGMAGEITLASRLGKPILLCPYWEIDVETPPATELTPESIVLTLRSGKTLTLDDLDSVRESLHHLDDLEDVQTVLDSGIHDDDLVFGPVPAHCLHSIAQRKAVLERQQSYSWQDAVEQALQEWRDSEYARLLEMLWKAYIQKFSGTEMTAEEFEHSPLLFRSEKTIKLLASPQDLEIWRAVVPAAQEKQKHEPEAGELSQ